jgi:hypothetical protein
MPKSNNITLKLSLKSLLILVAVMGLIIFAISSLSKKSQEKMLVYDNKKFGVKFQYPASLVLEEEVSSGENLLTLEFIGQACSHIPPRERPNFPSLSFSIKPQETAKKGIGFCQSDSPNCRGGTTIGPFNLVSGLEAEIDKVFGVSTDATGISLNHQGLVYRFATTSTATNCGDKFDYLPEIFQMANSLKISP